TDAVSEVSCELLHFAYDVAVPAGVFGRVPLQQHGVVAAHHIVAVGLRGLIVALRRLILRDLTEDPRVGAGGAADHNGVATGLADHAGGIFGSEYIAVADYGDFDRGFYFGDAGPVGLAAVALLAGARVQGDGLQSAFLGELRHADGDEFLVAPAGAE